MKNRRKYFFIVADKIVEFSSNTRGGAFDKCIRFWKVNWPRQPRPLFQN